MKKEPLKIDKYVELHNHLSTSSTPHTLWELAHAQGIRLPKKDYWEFIDLVQITEKTTPKRYHEYFDLIQMIQSSPAAVEASVYEAVSLSHRKSNVDLLEIKLNPMKRNREGLFDLDRILFSAYVGMRRAMMEYPVKAGIIVEADARFDQKSNEIIINKAIDFKDEGIIGVDISGLVTEDFSFKPFKKMFKRAKDAGLKVTVHAGELNGPEEVWDALENVNPDRIGHGIASVEDEELMKELKKRDILLEVCPTSNIMIGAVKDWFDMALIIRKLVDNGVKIAISADNPVLLRTNVKNELNQVYERDILDKDEIEQTLKDAREFSFVK
jgi:adenosine deaminase